jgi:uncharacterized membrane protein YgcG
VYHYDVASNSWKQVDDGISRVDLYMSSSLAAFRVVGVSAKTSEVVVNSPVYREMKYQRVTNLFHQWSDTRLSYGLNFASIEEAQAFAQAVDAALLKLVQPTAPAPPVVHHTRTGSVQRLQIGAVRPKETAAAAVAAAAATAAQSQQADDIPPPPPVVVAAIAAPALSVTAEDLTRKIEERSSRSATSGSGRSHHSRDGDASTGSTGGGGGSSTTSSSKSKSASKADIEMLRKEIETAKREILEAISRISGKPVVFPPPPPPIV